MFKFLYLNEDVQLSQYHVLQRLSLFQSIAFAWLSETSPIVMGNYFWALYCFMYLFVHSSLIPFCLDYVTQLSDTSSSWGALFLQLCLILRYYVTLTILDLLLFHLNLASVCHLPQNNFWGLTIVCIISPLLDVSL